jgi:hypothetical protein
LIVGLVLGVLIGVITGTVFLLLLKTAVGISEKGSSSILTLTSELLAIPTFWFGGPWLTGKLLVDARPAKMLNPYVISLTIIFLVMASYPAGRWIIHMGKTIGRGSE